MSPNSGHLITNLSQMKAGDSYEMLPDSLQGEARSALGGASETHIPLKGGGKLSKWAAGRRAARKRMAKASRKRNR